MMEGTRPLPPIPPLLRMKEEEAAHARRRVGCPPLFGDGEALASKWCIKEGRCLKREQGEGRVHNGCGMKECGRRKLLLLCLRAGGRRGGPNGPQKKARAESKRILGAARLLCSYAYVLQVTSCTWGICSGSFLVHKDISGCFFFLRCLALSLSFVWSFAWSVCGTMEVGTKRTSLLFQPHPRWALLLSLSFFLSFLAGKGTACYCVATIHHLNLLSERPHGFYLLSPPHPPTPTPAWTCSGRTRSRRRLPPFSCPASFSPLPSLLLPCWCLGMARVSCMPAGAVV